MQILNKLLYIFLLLIILIGCQKGIVVNLPINYCGDVYLIIRKDSIDNRVINVDSNGVGYISSNVLLIEGEYVDIDIFENKVDITSQCVNIADGHASNNNFFKTYNYLYFYKKCGDRKGNKKSTIRMKKLNKMINTGLVK